MMSSELALHATSVSVDNTYTHSVHVHYLFSSLRYTLAFASYSGRLLNMYEKKLTQIIEMVNRNCQRSFKSTYRVTYQWAMRGILLWKRESERDLWMLENRLIEWKLALYQFQTHTHTHTHSRIFPSHTNTKARVYKYCFINEKRMSEQ